MSVQTENRSNYFVLIDQILLIALVAALVIGVGVRVYRLGEISPYIPGDETFNGRDAVRVARDGYTPIYFPDNNGREPLFIYTAALTTTIFGRNMSGLRAASAFYGLLVLPLVYVLCLKWFDKRTALISTSLMAVVLWQVILGRTGFRAVTVPFAEAIFAVLSTFAFERKSTLLSLAAGAALGLCAYTYAAARLIPVVIILWLIYGLVFQRAWILKNVRLLALAFVGAAVVAAPLILFAIQQPDIYWARVSRVGERPSLIALPAYATFYLQNLRALFLVVVGTEPRFLNFFRPAFNLLASIAALLGIFWPLKGEKVHGRNLILIWVAIMILPAALSYSVGALRTVGIWPFLAMLPAVGLSQLMQTFEGSGKVAPYAATGLLTLVVVYSTAYITFYELFLCGPSGSMLEGGCAEYASWTRRIDQVSFVNKAHNYEGHKYVTRQAYTKFPYLEFLRDTIGDIEIVDAEEFSEIEDLPALLIAMDEEYNDSGSLTIPSNAHMEVYGEDSLGMMYLTEGTQPPPEPIVEFKNGVLLHMATVHVEDPSLAMIDTVWSTHADIDTEELKLNLYLIQTSTGIVLQERSVELGWGMYPVADWYELDNVVVTQPIRFISDSKLTSDDLVMQLQLFDDEHGLVVLIEEAVVDFDPLFHRVSLSLE